MPDLLPAFALKDLEIVLTEAGNQALLGVSNGDWYEHQVDIHLDRSGMGVERHLHWSSPACRYGRFAGRVDMDFINEALSGTGRGR